MNYYDKKKDKRNKTYEELIFNEPSPEEKKVENVTVSTKDGWLLVYTAFKVVLPQLLLLIIPLVIISLLLRYYFPYQGEEMLYNIIKIV